jgi:hypothetical protein
MFLSLNICSSACDLVGDVLEVDAVLGGDARAALDARVDRLDRAPTSFSGSTQAQRRACQ